MSVPVTAYDQVAPRASDAAQHEEASAQYEYDLPEDDGFVDHSRERWLPTIPVFAAMAFIGATSGFGWWYFGPPPSPPASWTPTAQAAAASSIPTASEVTRHVQELEALKKRVAELVAANQQMAATIASLQASQQDQRQRTVSPQMQGWHSNPAVMKYRVVPPQKVASNTAPSRAPGAPADARPAPRPGESGPLKLSAPRP